MKCPRIEPSSPRQTPMPLFCSAMAAGYVADMDEGLENITPMGRGAEFGDSR